MAEPRLELPRCTGCGSATGAEAFDAVELRCGCGHGFSRAFHTGGVGDPLEVGWKDVLGGRGWLDAYLAVGESDERVVAGCPSCSRPVGLPLRSTVDLSCTHCAVRTPVAVADALLDAVPAVSLFGEPWGGRFNLSWTPHLRTGRLNGDLPCPSCGAALPDGSGRIDCPHCASTVYATLACGTRFLPGVMVEGRQDQAGVRGWMPIVSALDHYGRLLELRTTRRRLTRQSFLGVGLLGVGLVGGGVVMLLAAALAGLKPALIVFGVTVVGVMLGMAGLMARLVLGIAGETKRLGLGGPPPVIALKKG